MSNCHACSKPIQFKYRTQGGEPMLNPDGTQLIEDLCETCIEASRVNRPAEYYGGTWVDKHCHESHIVQTKPEDYLV